MIYSHEEYALALYRLHYIDMAKARLCECLTLFTDASLGAMQLSPAEKEHAAQCIRETIDDLYYDHAILARHTKETAERERWRDCVRQWSVP